MKLKNQLKAAIAGLGLVTAISAQADNIGGVILNPNSLVDFTAQSALYETNINMVGDVLHGIGIVSGINGVNTQSTFCPGCELTFDFTYTLTGAGDFDGNGTTDLLFTGGVVNFYVDNAQNFDFNNAATASDGTLWLSLAGHSDFDPNLGQNAELFGELDPGVALTSNNDSGDGKGLLDVVGGLPVAVNRFDTNSLDDFAAANVADFFFTSSFQPFPSGGSTPDNLSLVGTGELTGNAIPEPGTIALLGAGLFGLGMARRRRKQ